jgi:hypothetical protein
MFGYLLPDKQELKVKEYALYRAAYCGVCRAIKLSYGELPRFAVSWDAAVLALLMIGASDADPKARPRGCALNPVEKRPVLEAHDALKYTAAMSVMLARGRLRDAWADERRFLALPASALLWRADARARRDYPAAAACIAGCLKDLYALEKAGCAEIDRTADAMGRMIAGIAENAPAIEARNAVPLKAMCYQLGRWIYLVDALDDREKDTKSGAYNPIRAMGGGAEAVEMAKRACVYAASQAAALYDLVDMRRGGEIISNVLYAGMPGVFDKACKEKGNDGRSVENAGDQAGRERGRNQEGLP